MPPSPSDQQLAVGFLALCILGYGLSLASLYYSGPKDLALCANGTFFLLALYVAPAAFRTNPD